MSVFGFIYENLSYGKLSPENPIHFDNLLTAILFTGTSHSAVVFAVVVMISFQTSPSAGKYALRRSFYDAFKYSLSYAILDIIPGTYVFLISPRRFSIEISLQRYYNLLVSENDCVLRDYCIFIINLVLYEEGQ